ncbi:MAG: deoxyguanosinetriphosphate triphosphohydrolase [Candidatus Omnitrophota bacterium]
MLSIDKIYNIEELTLAPYAMKSKDSRGRGHKEKEHAYRSIYQRDRDRIVYSTAFRRLQYKTQVFVNYEGDHYRTRLTHTLEVAQIARSIARALQLNQDLTEAIAMAHDIGHTPFGHAGEAELHELMKDHRGFEHNRQGLRIVDLLEKKYPNFTGLNLTWEVREGIIKHQTLYDRPEAKEFEPNKFPTLETQVVNCADEIAYDNHDLDDGLRSGLISIAELKDISLYKDMSMQMKNNDFDGSSDIYRHQLVRNLIDFQINNLLIYSEKILKELKIKSVLDVRNAKKTLITFTPNMLSKRKYLQSFLMEKLYKNYKVMRMSDKARRFINQLFKVYLAKPKQLPPTVQQWIKAESKYRAICDYIAGMTDRYALDEYKKLFTPYERV